MVTHYHNECCFGSLFHYAFSVTRLYIVDDRVISEWWWIWKDSEGSGRGIRLEGLRKTTKTSNRVAGLGTELSPVPPECEAGVLTTRPRRSVKTDVGCHDVKIRKELNWLSQWRISYAGRPRYYSTDIYKKK